MTFTKAAALLGVALLAGCGSLVPIPTARIVSSTGEAGINVARTDTVDSTGAVVGTQVGYVITAPGTTKMFALPGSLGARITRAKVEIFTASTVSGQPYGGAVGSFENSVLINVTSGFRCPGQDEDYVSPFTPIRDCDINDPETFVAPGLEPKGGVPPIVFANKPLTDSIATDVSGLGQPTAVYRVRLTYSGLDTNNNPVSFVEENVPVSATLQVTKVAQAAGQVAVAVSPPSATVNVGATAQLTATVTGNSNTAVSWASSNAGVATVSNAGLVTGVAPGTATITASSQADPTKTGTATITVP